MSKPQPNPWLEAAIAARELLRKESPEVQATQRRMDGRNYPATQKALRKQEQEETED